MRIHKNIVQAVVKGLEEIFGNNAHADQIVKKQIKLDRRWGARDRRFIAESIYDIVRWWRWYLAIGELNEQDTQVYTNILAVYLREKNIEFPEWFQVDIPDSAILGLNKIKFGNELKFSASIPDWLINIGNKEVGEIWRREITALNQPTDVVLRVNKLKTNTSNLINSLRIEGLEVEELIDFPDALILKNRVDLNQIKSFKSGLFEVQDAASQLVAPFTKAKSGMTVIDACAGAGGKTLHLAAQMNNSGRILSLDVEKSKLAELENRCQRAGCRNVSTHLVHDQQINELRNQADILLIDAPCSGLGVLRRKPDTKWKMNPERIEELKELQEKILDEYKVMLKPGGSLVYVTCSILTSENEDQIAKFLVKNKEEYILEDEKKVLPSEGFDGFYMARLRKSSITSKD